MCRPRACLAIGFEKRYNPGTGHDIHGCASGHQMDGIGRASHWTTIRPAGTDIATLHRVRPGIIIEVRWCPAHKGIAGNEKADKWAKTAAEEPDSRGVDWLNYDYDSEVRAVPLPRSLANLKWMISEQEWMGAHLWAGGRCSKMKYKMPKSHRPDGTVSGSTKRIASRFYQMKTRHCLTGRYLNWTKNRATPRCGCRYPQQTGEHLFK